MYHRVAWLILTDVSEDLTASIIRVMTVRFEVLTGLGFRRTTST
jgi:hypothetical protein